jgi:ATP-dependent helicase/nuclease subunit B
MPRSRFPDDNQPDLFAAPAPSSRPSLYSIAPHAPFLFTLVDRILDGTLLGDWRRTGPFWLTDITIILPTRRARLALAQAFLDRGHRLLPDIRTLAGEHQDEEPFLPPTDAPDLPLPVSATERRLVLARLIEAWAKTPAGAEVLATPPNAAEIISLADSLGEVIDDLAVEDVPFSALRTLPPEDLAANWQQVLRFLEIAFEAWPAYLTDRGLVDAVALRNLRLRRQAEAAPRIFSDRPVIAAGSTGSIPATADLLAAVARLPRGALVLPGLDTSLTPEQHARLLKIDSNPHCHPQYGLARLLRRLGAGPGEVIELADTTAPRTAVVRTALMLADDTGQWTAARARLAPDLGAAADGLTVIAAHTADEQARAVALCARDALARPGRTVGIVTPDQTLARRIAAELERFGIVVDDSAGTPLFLSPAGRLARIILALHQNDYGPVELIALLRNRATALGLERETVRRLADRIELCLLRGRRLKPGLAGLREALDRSGAGGSRGPMLKAEERDAVADLFGRLEVALAPLANPSRTSADFAQALHKSLLAITDQPNEISPSLLLGADEFATWADDLAAHPGHGPALPARDLDNVLYALMHGHTVRDPERRRDDIFIWGLLEARLQSPDVIILAGLNEDIWPETADPGPWLSRGMRLALGLEPPERRQGQAAHDFQMAVGNPHCVLAYAERLGTAPALPSRLLQRLEALLGDDITRDMRQRGRRWIVAAAALDEAPVLLRAARPMPSPPAALRPKRLSVTEIETLFRSPYDLYAKHTLGLRKLAPLGEAPDARDRGNIVHDIFARFVTDHDVMAPDAAERLQAIADEEFSRLDMIAARRDIWLHRFAVGARQFLAFERERQVRMARRLAEVAGAWALPAGFTLTGRADRIDILADGTAELIDFKTGGIPDSREMTEFLAPQLPLEAAMLGAGAFEGVSPAEVSAMTYIKVSLGPDAFELHPYRVPEGSDLGAVADEMARRLQTHVDALLLRDALPMAPRVLPRPDGRQRYRGDYDHLGRNDEWTINEGDDSE